MQERDLQALRDQIFGQAEGDAVVGGCDAKDVRPLRRVDQSDSTLVGDADRNVRLVRERPRCVDARSLVDDRDRVLRDGAPYVGDRRHRRAAGVVLDDLDRVVVVAGGQRAACGKLSTPSLAPFAIVFAT